MGYEIEFYKTESGRDPVSDFIKTLDKKQAAKIYRNIGMLRDFGADLHFPYVDFIKGDKYKGLMELRTIQAKNIFRIFYFVIVKDTEKKTERAVLLHAVQKKTDRTPKKELDTALMRMKEYKAQRQENGRL